MTDHLHAAGQNQEDFQIESEEKPSNEAAEAAAHSPVVGEKRLRDEDDSEHRREAPSDGGGTPGFRSESSPAPGQNSNGAYSGQTGNTNTNTANTITLPSATPAPQTTQGAPQPARKRRGRPAPPNAEAGPSTKPAAGGRGRKGNLSA